MSYFLNILVSTRKSNESTCSTFITDLLISLQNSACLTVAPFHCFTFSFSLSASLELQLPLQLVIFLLSIS
jgi:hypothetical protein